MAQVTAFPYSTPPRAEVLVQGSSASRLNVYRLVGDSPPVLVRGAIRLLVTDPLAVVDYEAPVGVPVVYSVQELNALGQSIANTSSAAVTVADEGSWLSQPLYPERVVKVTQLDGSFLEQSRDAAGDHVRPGGRDLGVWLGSGRGGVRGRFSFAVQSETDRAVVESMFGLRGEQVPPVLCLRSTLAQRLPQPMYLAVPRFSQRGVNWHMDGDLTVFEWDVEETSPPSPAIIRPTYTYSDLEAAYTGAISTNLVANPSFETNATGWSGSRTPARAVSTAASGTAVGRVTAVSGDTTLFASTTVPVPLLAGVPYSARVAARASYTGAFADVSLSWRDSGGAVVGSTAVGALTAVPTSGWAQLIVEGVQAPAGAVQAVVQVTARTSAGAVYAPAASQRLEVDAALLVQAPTAAVYFDGSSAGADWLGTAHASQSYLTANTYRAIELGYQTYSDIERDYDLGGL